MKASANFSASGWTVVEPATLIELEAASAAGAVASVDAAVAAGLAGAQEASKIAAESTTKRNERRIFFFSLNVYQYLNDSLMVSSAI
jgi:hypothetical protein